jgi:uncharacterized membrane protein YjjB (DUF3815 family)
MISLVGASVEIGALVACLVVGIIVTPIADRLRMPFAAFAFASVVSLIPGVYLFRMAGGFVDLVTLGEKASVDMLLNTIADGTTAMLIILAMAFGLILPKMCIEHLYPSLVDPSLVDPSLVDPSLVDPSLVDPSLVELRPPGPGENHGAENP